MTILNNDTSRELLITLKGNKRLSLSDAARKLNVAYSYIGIVVKKLIVLNLLDISNRDGRSKYVFLTEKGEKIGDLLFKVEEIMKNGR